MSQKYPSAVTLLTHTAWQQTNCNGSLENENYMNGMIVKKMMLQIWQCFYNGVQPKLLQQQAIIIADVHHAQ